MCDDATADAPGRVNLIGEHTDYHEGYVLPMTLPQRTRVHLCGRGDHRIRVRSAAIGEAWETFDVGRESGGRGWVDYIQGVTWVLARHSVIVPGVDIHVESDVPVGAGVSSSAALEISLLRAFRSLLVLDFDDVALARMAHDVETAFVGAPVGIMDQMVCSVGRDGEALFLDTRTLEVARVPLPSDIDFVVIHSGVAHAHASGEYLVRRRESFEAAALLGVEYLRDVDAASLAAASLPPVLARRARHVVTENQRVVEAVGALRKADGVELGRLFDASHASMRDDYEISTPAIDLLVHVAHDHPDVYGARLTGGGFGGAVVLIARAGSGERVAAGVAEAYQRVSGHHALVLLPTT
jgi:galactokinase